MTKKDEGEKGVVKVFWRQILKVKNVAKLCISEKCQLRLRRGLRRLMPARYKAQSEQRASAHSKQATVEFKRSVKQVLTRIHDLFCVALQHSSHKALAAALLLLVVSNLVDLFDENWFSEHTKKSFPHTKKNLTSCSSADNKILKVKQARLCSYKVIFHVFEKIRRLFGEF